MKAVVRDPVTKPTRPRHVLYDEQEREREGRTIDLHGYATDLA